jgi:hypothetical protein
MSTVKNYKDFIKLQKRERCPTVTGKRKAALKTLAESLGFTEAETKRAPATKRARTTKKAEVNRAEFKKAVAKKAEVKKEEVKRAIVKKAPAKKAEAKKAEVKMLIDIIKKAEVKREEVKKASVTKKAVEKAPAPAVEKLIDIFTTKPLTSKEIKDKKTLDSFNKKIIAAGGKPSYSSERPPAPEVKKAPADYAKGIYELTKLLTPKFEKWKEKIRDEVDEMLKPLINQKDNPGYEKKYNDVIKKYNKNIAENDNLFKPLFDEFDKYAFVAESFGGDVDKFKEGAYKFIKSQHRRFAASRRLTKEQMQIQKNN